MAATRFEEVPELRESRVDGVQQPEIRDIRGGEVRQRLVLLPPHTGDGTGARREDFHQPPRDTAQSLAGLEVEQRRKPRTPLICPNTGSTSPFRNPYTARPPAVRNFARIRSTAVAPGGTDASKVAAGAWCFCRSVATYGSNPSPFSPDTASALK